MGDKGTTPPPPVPPRLTRQSLTQLASTRSRLGPRSGPARPRLRAQRAEPHCQPFSYLLLKITAAVPAAPAAPRIHCEASLAAEGARRHGAARRFGETIKGRSENGLGPLHSKRFVPGGRIRIRIRIWIRAPRRQRALAWPGPSLASAACCVVSGRVPTPHGAGPERPSQRSAVLQDAAKRGATRRQADGPAGLEFGKCCNRGKMLMSAQPDGAAARL